jgi:hypothetical protein
MLEVLGEKYYIDFKGLETEVNIPFIVKKNLKKIVEETVEEPIQQINVVKFETIKMMLEVVLTEREEMDDNLGVVTSKNLSLPFRIAFNTLLRYGIIKYI